MTPGDGVRRAGRADLGALTRLWTELARHHVPLDDAFALRDDAEPAIERLLAAQLDDPDAALFVWEESGAVRGFCAVRIDTAPPIQAETRRAEICDLGVDADARRRGIGRALASAASAWVESRGVGRVEVRVAARNPAGQAFWRALGYGDWLDVLHRRL